MDKAKIWDSVTKAGRWLVYSSTKTEQLDVAMALLQGRDVFAGFGKSLCYACLPAAFDILGKREHGYIIVVVVTPLLAIMKDQVRLIISCIALNIVITKQCTYHLTR